LLIDNRADETPPVDYAARVNRAIDHIVSHLDEPLRLEDVAAVAYFSPFHFHRVFRTLMGETLQRFVKRLRLERALFLMSHQPRRSLTEVALACGFSSSSDFTRSFRQRYGVPPSAFDLASWRERKREDLQDTVDASERYHLSPRLEPGENPDGFSVTLRDLPARRVAYVRVLDPFRSDGVVEACERLVAWAEARGAADGQWLGYMWEDPEIVALEDCRYDVAVVLDDVEPDDRVGTFGFPAMRVAEVVIRGGLDLEQRAIDWLFRTWLPTSGYVPDDQPCFEAWIGRPFAHGLEHLELAAHLPVIRG
jgi:AraC family transcriptional regulator